MINKIETLCVKSLKIESSSCQCSMTSKRTKRGNSERCFQIPNRVNNYAVRFSRGHWTFLGPRDEKKFHGTPSYTPEGKWDSIAAQMVQRVKETSQPVFKSISALSRGILTRKINIDTIYFSADASNTALLFRTSHSANQLIFYGAVSSWCEELGQKAEWKRPDFGKVRGQKENEQLLKNAKPQEVKFFCQIPRSDIQHLETHCENVFRDLQHWRKISNLQKFPTMRHSGKESLLECATRPLQT